MHLYGTQAIDAEGHLTIGGVRAADLAQRFGTPLYVFDEALIRRNCQAYMEAFRTRWPDFVVAYASKAFLCTAMAALAHQEGLYLDVVSGGELTTALTAGVPAEHLIFHGNNKSPAELDLALEAGAGRIVVDSLAELELLAGLAAQKGVRPRIAFRITPGVEAHTHHYISTGQLDSKFGISIAGGAALAAVRQALATPAVELTGLHCHIGSQIFDLTGYQAAAERMVDFMAEVRQETGWTCPELNMGGGLGIRYTAEDTPTTPEKLVALLTETVRARAEAHGLPLPRLIVEPGRSIVAEAGTTLYTVGTIKEIPGVRTYLAVDGGMGDNPRPALYQAKYEAVVANKAAKDRTRVVSVAGRACESGDMLIWDLPVAGSVGRGDILAVFATGAYNYSMASHYNRFPKPAVVFVRDGQADLVVARETWEDLMRYDRLPSRLQPGSVRDKAVADPA